MKPEDWVAAAGAIWLSATALVTIAWFISDRAFLRAHHLRYRQFLSDDERWDALLSKPGETLRQIPGDTLSRMNAVLTPVDDPAVERLRRRTLRLLVLVPALMFGGFPAMLIVMLGVRTLFNYGGPLVLPGVIIVVSWVLILGLNIRRYRYSRLLIGGALIGVLIGAGLIVVLPALLSR